MALGALDVGGGGSGYQSPLSSVGSTGGMKRAILATSNDAGQAAVSPTAGYKIRLWAFLISFTNDATFASASGSRAYLFFTANQGIGDIATYQAAGTVRHIEQAIALPFPIIGATDGALTIENADRTAGTSDIRCVVFYDEVL